MTIAVAVFAIIRTAPFFDMRGIGAIASKHVGVALTFVREGATPVTQRILKGINGGRSMDLDLVLVIRHSQDIIVGIRKSHAAVHDGHIILPSTVRQTLLEHGTHVEFHFGHVVGDQTVDMLHVILIAIAYRPYLSVYQAITLHALSVRHAFGVPAIALQTIDIHRASAMLGVASIAMDRFDTDHLGKTRCRLFHKVIRFRLGKRLNGTRIGIAEIGIGFGIIIYRIDLVRHRVNVPVPNYATIFHTFGIAARANFGRMAGTARVTVIVAVHTVHAATAHCHAAGIVTAARQYAMFAGATRLAQFSAVRSSAAAVLNASITGATVFQIGTSAMTMLAVASSNAVYVATASCFTFVIRTTARQRRTTAITIARADLIAVFIVATAVCHAVFTNTTASRHHTAGTGAVLFTVFDLAHATAVQVAFHIITAAGQTSTTAITIATLQTVLIITTAHCHAHGLGAGATGYHTMRAGAMFIAKTSEHAVYHAVARTFFQASFALATTRELGDARLFRVLFLTVAEQRSNIDAPHLNAVQAEKRRIHVKRFVQAHEVGAHEQALHALGLHIKVHNKLTSFNALDVQVSFYLQAESRFHFFAYKVKAFTEYVHEDIVHIQLLFDKARIQQQFGIHVQIFQDQRIHRFIVKERRKLGHVLGDLGTDILIAEAHIIQFERALDISCLQVFIKIKGEVDLILIDRHVGRGKANGQFDLQRRDELGKQDLKEGVIQPDIHPCFSVLRIGPIRDQNAVYEFAEQGCVSCGGRRSNCTFCGAGFIAVSGGQQIRNKGSIHSFDQEFLHVEPRHIHVDLLLQNVHIRLDHVILVPHDLHKEFASLELIHADLHFHVHVQTALQSFKHNGNVHVIRNALEQTAYIVFAIRQIVLHAAARFHVHELVVIKRVVE